MQAARTRSVHATANNSGALIPERPGPRRHFERLHREGHRLHAFLEAGGAVQLRHGYPEVAGAVDPHGIGPDEARILHQYAALAGWRHF